MTTLLPDRAMKLFTLLCVACVMFPAIADTQAPLWITSPPPPSGTIHLSYGGWHQDGCGFVGGWPLTATGGARPIRWWLDPSPYHWSWSAAPGSSLPPGLEINFKYFTCGGSTRCCSTQLAAYIAGVPTAAGTYHVIVNVVDTIAAPAPAHASANYTIVITK